jgi:tetratricopeptide (TPR) repeat protein
VSVNISLRHLLVPLALVCASSAQAQLIDDVDFRREGADAVLQVRFVTPIQYRRALIAKSGDAVQVIFDVVNARDNATLVPSERRLAGGGAMPDISVTDESPGRENVNRKLAVRLSKPVPFRVRAGRGDRTIEVVLFGLGTAIPASVKAPAAPTRTSGFQISLQQSDSQNIQLDTPIPSALQRYQVFTGERMLNGKRVFEINLGYFDTLVEAESARQLLAKRFPEASIVALTPPPPPVAAVVAPAPTPAPIPTPLPTPTPPPVPVAVTSPVGAAAPDAAASAPAALPSAAETGAQAAALLAAAKAADAQQDSTTALDKLNQLLNLPANPSTREAQALAGDIRAKTGDSVRARAEYETFLQLYPSGPDADRVRAALTRLPAAAPTPKPAAIAAQKAKPTVEPTSTLAGSASAFYYGGASKVRTQEFQDSPISGLPELASDNTLSGTDQSLLLSNVDVNWRYRDADTDMRFVFRDAYSADLKNSAKSKNRLSALYFEHRSLSAGTQVRLGRQSPTGGGILSRYDGVQAGYTFAPKWRVNGAAGLPTEKLLDSKRSFYGVWIDADALTSQLSGSLYFNRQLIDGEVDRSAIGSEMRFFSGGVSANGIVDYDHAIHGLNIVSLQGTWQMEDNSVVNVLLDRRKTPLLMLGNALFFQDPALPLALRLKDLLGTSTLDALRERVRGTTSNTTQGLIGATTPINKNWHVGADVRLTDVGQILPVADILPSGQGRNRNTSLGGQVIGTNLYSNRDTHVFGASWQRGTNYSLTSTNVDRYSGKLLTYNNSSQVTELLLLEPSLKFYLQTDTAGVRTTRWSPGLRATYRVVKQVSIESELSGEYSKSTGPSRNETSSRLFYYLGGRYDF